MCKIILTTECTSVTGSFLYSDTYATSVRSGENIRVEKEIPFLTELAAIPVLGIVAGITRCALAIIHMIGHLFASIIFWNIGHLYHVVKGGAEMLRGGIEMIPIVGRVFVWYVDAPAFALHGQFQTEDESRGNVFLVRISHPKIKHPLDFVLKNNGY